MNTLDIIMTSLYVLDENSDRASSRQGLFLVCWGIWSSFCGIHSFSPKYPLVVRQPKAHVKPWTAEMCPPSLGDMHMLALSQLMDLASWAIGAIAGPFLGGGLVQVASFRWGLLDQHPLLRSWSEDSPVCFGKGQESHMDRVIKLYQFHLVARLVDNLEFSHSGDDVVS